MSSEPGAEMDLPWGPGKGVVILKMVPRLSPSPSFTLRHHLDLSGPFVLAFVEY